jgi:hypothetical protein
MAANLCCGVSVWHGRFGLRSRLFHGFLGLRLGRVGRWRIGFRFGLWSRFVNGFRRLRFRFDRRHNVLGRLAGGLLGLRRRDCHFDRRFLHGIFARR